MVEKAAEILKTNFPDLTFSFVKKEDLPGVIEIAVMVYFNDKKPIGIFCLYDFELDDEEKLKKRVIDVINKHANKEPQEDFWDDDSRELGSEGELVIVTSMFLVLILVVLSVYFVWKSFQ